MNERPGSGMLASGMALAGDAYAIFGWRVPVLFALTVLNAAFEGLTLAMLLPLLQVAGMGGKENGITRAVNGVFHFLGVSPTPLSIAEIFGVLLAASLAVFIAQAYFATRLQALYVESWQQRIFKALVGAHWSFLRRQPSGEILGALTTEATRIGGAFYQANLIGSSVIFLVVQMIVALVIAPAVTALLLVMSVLLFRVTRPMVTRAVRIGGELTEANAGLFATVGEVTASMKTIKATASEDNATVWIARRIRSIRDLTFRNAFDVQLVRAVFEYASSVAIIALLLLGPLFLNIDVAAVLVVLAIFVRLFPKVTALRQCLQSIGLVLPAYDALQELLAKANAARETIHGGASVARREPARIELRDVSVAGDRDEPILRDITLDISPGEHVAFVGPTGAGKTTLLDCILGLAHPSAGDVRIDGERLDALSLADWRHSIGYLGQEPVILAGTVRENVAWNRTGASDDDIAGALKAADADFALMRPAGLDAPVSERGGSLSGGERQRIALARALLGAPRLLVLDEATSALDVETEGRIAAALGRRRGQLTILTITHRLASARNADRIVLLERGEIVEQAGFAELLARDGRFAAMWRAQSETGHATLVEVGR